MTLSVVTPIPSKSIVDKNIRDSLIKHKRLHEARIRVSAGRRGPLLPPWGSRERERDLRLYWHHDNNSVFRGSVAFLNKRVQSTPWEIKSKREDGNQWQQVLMQADFGDFERFISKIVIDYCRHDQGSFIELIAPGDPRGAPIGPVEGLAVLDSVRCYPTGDPTYPVLYYDIDNGLHYLHRARVIQIVDTPDSSEDFPGYGDCALSRSISAVRREILMGRYIEQSLDDEPPPGVTVFGNVDKSQVDAAIEKMQRERTTDQAGEWGRMLRLYGLHTEDKPTVDTISFSRPPEKFDFELYTNLDARIIALALGLDFQDIWGELTGQGLGSGQQSQILNQKARGKGLGRILKTLERKINLALPEDVEFTWKYEDPQEDMEQAQILQTTAQSVQLLSTTLSQQEQRELLANKSEAVHDVLTDENGVVRRLSDTDVQPAHEEIREDVYARTPPEEPSARFATPETTAPPVQAAHKAFADTSANFASQFVSTSGGASGMTAAVLRSILRDQLMTAGLQAYEDGLRDGGQDAPADAEELARRRRVVATWNAAQLGYLEKFVDDVLSGGLSADQIAIRADLWVSKSLRAIYYAGMVDAESELVFPWNLGPTKEHCATCLSNSGQMHTMKEWQAAGMWPGSSELACGGWNCQCKFGDGVKGRSVGQLPGAARPSLVDRLGSWIRNLFRKG